MPNAYRNFVGEIPKDEPHLLPNSHARLALNCDFSEDALTPQKGGLLVQAMVNNPVKGLYTEDGLLFYTWAQETFAYPSPIVDDAIDRIYFLTPSEGLIKVATKAGMALNGPSPAASWNVGVPKPTVAPALRVVERSALPDYPSVTVSAVAWWNYGGTRYSEAAVALTTITPFKQYTFATPALPASPPSGTPVLEVKLTFADNNNAGATIMTATARAGSPGRSNALPGGVEVGLAIGSGGTSIIDVSWGIASVSAYVYCFQNDWGERGAPSPPATISCTYLQAVELTCTAGDFTGYRPFDKAIIYRTYGTAQAYIETAVAGAFPTYQDDSVKPNSVGAVMESTDWMPPVTGVEGLKLHPTGGFFAFFKDRTLYLTQPNYPHAVPYSTIFSTNIRGVEFAQGGLVVACAGGTYLCPGSEPAQMLRIPVPLDLPQQGIAQRAMVNVDGAAAFASPDGLPLVSGSLATMTASQKLFTRKKWRELFGAILDDASIRLAFFDGAVIASSHSQATGFTLRLDEGVGNFSRRDLAFDAMFPVPVIDALYYSVGANVYRWGAGDSLTMDWWGRDWIYPKEISIGALYIRASAAVRLRIYCDDTLISDEEVTTGWHRPQEAVLGRRWSFRLSGTATVYEFKWARSMGELKNVR